MKEQIKKALTEAGLTEDQINKRLTQVDKLNDSETKDGFNFWAKYGKVRLYWTHRANKNRKGFVDLINGTIHIDMPSMSRAMHVINEKSNFEKG